MNNVQLQPAMRNSRMLLGEVYFWTDTIKNWQNLLKDDRYKTMILSSWKELVVRGKIVVYGFVIMPNHVHVLWEMLEMNGKEMAHASFNKFTSHQFLHDLRKKSLRELVKYKENDNDRKHRFWQRDALAIRMDYRKKAEQKLRYIHLNPLQEKWQLVDRPEDYQWSSARFYETGIDDFGFLTHYRERF